MQEFFSRQTELLRAVIGIYRQGHISLNTLIQRIEAIGNMIATDAWKNAVFPIILSIEQVNAPLVEAKKNLTETEKAFVGDRLLELEEIIGSFETQDA